MIFSWGYGATAARLTPDQKVGSSNLSALIFQTPHSPNILAAALLRWRSTKTDIDAGMDSAVGPERMFPYDAPLLISILLFYMALWPNG